MSVLGPHALLVVTLPGTARFHNQPADGKSADDAVANGKILRRRKRIQRKFRNKRSTEGQHIFHEMGVFFRVNAVNSSAKHSDSFAFRRDRATMHRPCPHHASAEDHQAVGSKITEIIN
jgi:hypothetical protein